VRVSEVSPVVVVPYGDPCRHLWPEFLRILGPLLKGVGLEDELVKSFSNPRQCHLLRVFRIMTVLHLLLGEPLVHLLRILDLQIEQLIHRVDVDRDGHVLPINLADHLVLERRPLTQSVHILPHPIILRVEEVRPVLRDSNVRLLVVVVEAVPTYMVPLLDDQRSLTQEGCVPLSNDSPGETGPDDAVIVLLLEGDVPLGVGRQCLRRHGDPVVFLRNRGRAF